jgi:protein required for attachment to host cells
LSGRAGAIASIAFPFASEVDMATPKIRNGDWVVVCDGAKALIFENAGDPDLLNLVTKEAVAAVVNPATSDQGTDRPGRVHQSVGSSRSSVEQTDWHDRAEQSFLRDLAARLDRAVESGDMKAIVLVAPPRAMGVLRPELSQRVTKAIRGEVAKDYTGMPVDQIEKHLAA